MRRLRNAFTLIEILVAMSLVVVLVTVASTAFFQMLAMTRRMQALQTMDAVAKTTFEKLSGEVTAMHPCAALWLRSRPGTKEVEFIFMHSKFDRLDYIDTKLPWDVAGDLGYTDLLWSRWHWNASTEILSVAKSRPCRWTKVRNSTYWSAHGGGSMGSSESTFVSIPQLVREAGPGNDPESVLDLNRWNTGLASDVGDYADLVLNSTPLLYHCTALKIELRNLDGTSKLADGDQSLDWGANGTFVDGQQQTGLLTRPGLVRLSFTLNEGDTQRMYSFSFSTPSFTRY